MPRAPKRCPKEMTLGCRNFAPCPVHKNGWASKRQFTRDARLIRAIKRRAEHNGWQCEHCGRVDRAGQADHRKNLAQGGKDELINMWFLCTPCHKIKSIAEARYGRQVKKHG